MQSRHTVEHTTCTSISLIRAELGTLYTSVGLVRAELGTLYTSVGLVRAELWARKTIAATI